MAAVNNPKKRRAPNNSGPVRKKSHITKPSPISASKKVQRKAPITSTLPTEDETESEEEEEEEVREKVEGEDGDFDEAEEGEAELGDEGVEGDGMNVDKPAPRKDDKSVREAHKAQKVVHQERRAAKQHADVLAVAKPLWAQARRKEAKPAERQKDVEALMAAIRGRVQDVVFKHDASRMVQTIVKYGSQQIRNEVAAELKGRFRDLVQNKYSKFLVTKLMRSCPTHRTSILLEFRGHVVRLLLHREASGILADAYELYANAFERALLLYDFYGKEVALFTPTLAKGSTAGEQEKTALKRGLAGVLEGADVERRKRVLSAAKENLVQIMNNPDKGAISHAIYHRVLWEYLSQVNELDDDVLQDKLRREVLEACQEQLAEMVHTKDGSRIVREFIAQGTAKDRKQAVKVLKQHVQKMCADDEAQNVLFTALDVIDDTKLTAKSLVSEITARATTLYASPQGRRALLYLLVPRSSRYFTPAQSTILAETDKIRERMSKKDATLRREEILKAASPQLIGLLEEKKRAEELVRDPGGSLLVTEIMLCAQGDKAKAIDSLIALLNDTYPAPTDATPHIIDIPHANRIYKTLLQGGHFSQATQSVVRAPETSFSPTHLASAWLKGVSKDHTRAMGLGGGAFVLAALVEHLQAEGSDEEKGVLKSWFDEGYIGQLQDADVKGKKILLAALGNS